jgi:hypothetical protein
MFILFCVQLLLIFPVVEDMYFSQGTLSMSMSSPFRITERHPPGSALLARPDQPLFSVSNTFGNRCKARCIHRCLVCRSWKARGWRPSRPCSCSTGISRSPTRAASARCSSSTSWTS